MFEGGKDFFGVADVAIEGDWVKIFDIIIIGETVDGVFSVKFRVEGGLEDENISDTDGAHADNGKQGAFAPGERAASAERFGFGGRTGGAGASLGGGKFFGR